MIYGPNSLDFHDVAFLNTLFLLLRERYEDSRFVFL